MDDLHAAPQYPVAEALIAAADLVIRLETVPLPPTAEQLRQRLAGHLGELQRELQVYAITQTIQGATP